MQPALAEPALPQVSGPAATRWLRPAVPALFTPCSCSLEAPYEDFGAGFVLFVRAEHFTQTASLVLLAGMAHRLTGSRAQMWCLGAAALLMLMAYV